MYRCFFNRILESISTVDCVLLVFSIDGSNVIIKICIYNKNSDFSWFVGYLCVNLFLLETFLLDKIAWEKLWHNIFTFTVKG